MDTKMKIIFLDIDGVLNSSETCKHFNEKYGSNGYGGFFKPDDACTDENVKWGQSLVDNLKSIVEATGASIVISSTWRKHYTVDKFKEMFAVYGWDNAPVIDKTVRLATHSVFDTYCRGDEIAQWVKENNPESFVIIDDDNDMLPGQPFVQTDFERGLQVWDAKRSIELLNHHPVK